MKVSTLEMEILALAHSVLALRIADMSGPVQQKQIVLYSSDASVRATVIAALGRRVAADLAENAIHEFATGPALRVFVDARPVIDLFILDGESAPEGGLGIARQLKDEVFNCPPVLVITGRKEDAWLAAWSLAEASVIHPIDSFTMAETVAKLLRINNPVIV